MQAKWHYAIAHQQGSSVISSLPHPAKNGPLLSANASFVSAVEALFYLQIGPQQAMETPSSNAFELCVLLFSLWFDVRSCSLLHLFLSHPLSVGESFMLVPHRFSKELFSIVLLAFCKSMHWKLSFACKETSTSYYFSFSSCSRWGVDHFYQLLCTFLCWLWLRDIAWPLHGISFISVFIFNDLNSFFFNIATFLTLLSS